MTFVVERGRAWVIAVGLLVACGDDAPRPMATDAGADALDVDASTPTPIEPMAPAPPVIPWLERGEPDVAAPQLGPCPPGWRDVEIDGVAVCNPWPEAGADRSCAVDEVHLPGTPACARIGAACSADGWPVELDAGDAPVVWVDDDAPEGGDGTSRARAFRSAAAAAEAAPDDAVIAVASGTYDGGIALRGTQQLVGACVAGVSLTRSRGAEEDPVVLARGTAVGLRSVHVAASIGYGVLVVSGHADLRALRVSGAAVDGVRVEHASIDLADAVIRDARPSAAGGGGFGVSLLSESHGTITRVALIDNDAGGVFVRDGGTEATIEDVVVRGGLAGNAHANGIGVVAGGDAVLRRIALDGTPYGIRGANGTIDAELVWSGGGRGDPQIHGEDHAQVVARRVVVDGPGRYALASFGVGTELTVTDAVIRGVIAPASGMPSAAVAVTTDARLSLVRVHIADTEVPAAIVESAALYASDLHVRRTRALEGEELDVGAIFVGPASSFEGERVIFEDVELAALQASGGMIRASDVAILGVPSRARDGLFGRGVISADGSTVEIDRVLVRGAAEVGLYAAEGASLFARDVVVRDGLSRASDGSYGVGIAVYRAALATVERVRIERARHAGISVAAAAMLDGRDVRVEDTEPDVAGTGGFAVATLQDARVALDRAELVRSRGIGVVATGGASVDLRETIVTDTAQAPECSGCEAGFGLFVGSSPVGEGGSLVAHRFVVVDSDVCAVAIGEGGEMTLTEGELARAPVGACVQAPGYDLTRLMNDVRYVDLRTPVQATSYTPPSLESLAMLDAP